MLLSAHWQTLRIKISKLSIFQNITSNSWFENSSRRRRFRHTNNIFFQHSKTSFQCFRRIYSARTSRYSKEIILRRKSRKKIWKEFEFYTNKNIFFALCELINQILIVDSTKFNSFKTEIFAINLNSTFEFSFQFIKN